MKKQNLIILLCFLFLCPISSQGVVKRVLMIGNSYIYSNNLPDVLESLALSMGDSLDIYSSTPGGATFNTHTANSTTLALIQQGNWDFVVLQAQSQEPSFPPSQVATQTYPFAKRLDSLVHVSSPCAETLFFMTWGKKNGDPGNCAGYPILCTYAGVYSRLRESYMEMTADNQSTCVPVGATWDYIINNYPSIELFVSDGSHPNVNGTYLAACTFYSSIFKKSCAGTNYILSGVSQADANHFYAATDSVVLDSIETWQQHGNLPNAKFMKSVNQFTASFNNLSTRCDTYAWDFGDGSLPNYTTSPTHTYTNTGSYVVKLVGETLCDNESNFKDTVIISNNPNSIGNTNIQPLQFMKIDNSIFLNDLQGNCNITILDASGKTVFDSHTNDKKWQFDISNLVSGVYMCQVKSSNLKRVFKFIIP